MNPNPLSDPEICGMKSEASSEGLQEPQSPQGRTTFQV